MANQPTDIYLNTVGTVQASITETNDAATLGADCTRIIKKTGVHSRPIAAPDEYTSDLACQAATKLLQASDVAISDIGALLVCTQTPDHLIPGVSSFVHGKLGFPQDCFVVDINQGCSGFVLGTQLITALLRNTERPAILINADTYSRLIRPDDLTTRVLFGDAAAASLFSHAPQGLRVAYSRSFANGRGYSEFVAHNSALRKDEDIANGIYMNGPGILNFALEVVPVAFAQALQDNNLEASQIRMVLFHQANSFVVGQLAKKLKLSPEQVPENCATLGNTVSASIPLLLVDQLPFISKGDLIMAVGFGVGLSWGVTLFECINN